LAARRAAWWSSPFAVLAREFFAQFFMSEVATSDFQLRQAIVGVLAFLVTPGFILMISVFPMFQSVVIRARTLHAPQMVDAMLAVLASALIAYSMASVGLVAVMVWDSLAFDRRDAMVLGPLPVAGASIVGAKLAALTALMLGTAMSINLMSAVPFASGTADLFGVVVFVRHLTGILAATIGSAIFVFATVVTIRGALVLLGGARLASRLGPVLQCAFVCALLGVVVLVAGPGSASIARFDPRLLPWLPNAWFLALFEQIRGSTQPEAVLLSGRALAGLAGAIAGAIAVSVLGYRRQMTLALAPVATGAHLGRARIIRLAARLLTGRRAESVGTTEFVLLTLARSRPHQTIIAINVAVGITLVAVRLAAVAVWPAGQVPEALATAPVILAFWGAIGLRAAFHVPSELPAAWVFQASAQARSRAHWLALRSAMLACVLLPVLVTAAAVCLPVLSWQASVRHLLFTAIITVICVEAVALTVDFLPFTQPYRPGHARLRTRWWSYILGVYAFAIWPVRLALSADRSRTAAVAMAMSGTLLIVILEWIGQRRSRMEFDPEGETDPEGDGGATVLALTGVPVYRSAAGPDV
jgi:hypothetical protein